MKSNSLEDYTKSLAPAIGFINFQPSQFDYKNRISWIGMGFPDKAYRGKGYGTEALEWALEYAFLELGLHKISLGVHAFNEAAIKLYRKV